MPGGSKTGKPLRFLDENHIQLEMDASASIRSQVGDKQVGDGCISPNLTIRVVFELSYCNHSVRGRLRTCSHLGGTAR